MHIVAVRIRVKHDLIEEFKQATLLNAKASIQEAGILQFDFLQQQDDPAQFLLYEVYRESGDQLKHRETKHYLTWKECVEPMLAEPRLGVKYYNVFPSDSGWAR